MDAPIQPIFLFADSQLLFWSEDGELFLDRARQLLESTEPKAAYVGASNGDLPEFFELFRGAMQGIGISDCRMIPAEPSTEDLDFFDQADLILLAGGDPERGWRCFESNGLKQKVVERYYSGCLLMGISAGAMQLGLQAFNEPAGNGADKELETFETFKLIPLVIDVHDDPDWLRLHAVMPKVGDLIQGLGIPSGAGAIVHPDMTLEPVRRPLVELGVKNGEVRQSLVFPPGEEDGEAPDEAPEATPLELTAKSES